MEFFDESKDECTSKCTIDGQSKANLRYSETIYCYDLLDHSSIEYVLCPVLCPVCVHLLHWYRSMTYKYGFVLYWDIDLYSLWGIGRNVVILQKGFAVHQPWHFDLFCTKHFEIQSNEGFSNSGFETRLHAFFVQTVSIKLLYNLNLQQT